MSDSARVTIPQIVCSRWVDAVAKDNAMNWRALSILAYTESEFIRENESDHILAAALRGISATAHDNYMRMMLN